MVSGTSILTKTYNRKSNREKNVIVMLLSYSIGGTLMDESKLTQQALLDSIKRTRKEVYREIWEERMFILIQISS
jgi:hypothetical protein